MFKPTVGFEPTTYSLRKNCSTPELRWQDTIKQLIGFDLTHLGFKSKNLQQTSLDRNDYRVIYRDLDSIAPINSLYESTNCLTPSSSNSLVISSIFIL